MHVSELIRQICFLKASLHCGLVAQTETNIAAIHALGFKKAARVVKGTDDTPEKVAAFLSEAEKQLSILEHSFSVETKWHKALVAVKNQKQLAF